MRGLNLLPLLPALWPHWHHAGQMIWRIYGPCFSGHWPSPSSSSSSSLSLATTERDAADGQPAFRHHQCRLGDGRRAAWPDRRKRQGELNLFFPLSLSDQHQTPEISPLPGLTGRQTGGEATIHHQGRRSSLPQVGLQSFYPSTAVCDYSHAAVIDIPHTICLTSFLSMNYIRWFH